MQIEDLLNPLLPAQTVSCSATQPTGVKEYYNVRLNRETSLSTLYEYPIGFIPEYPSTSLSSSSPVGHLLHVHPAAPWPVPAKDFCYSLGSPRGSRSNVYCDPLKDGDGILVPCTKLAVTCQGIKYCPFTSPTLLQQSHTSADRNMLHARLAADAAIFSEHSSAEREVIERTLALYQTVRDLGCTFPRQEPTIYLSRESAMRQATLETPTKSRRGQRSDSCEGRILYLQMSDGYPYLRCEHYHRGSRKHLLNMKIAEGGYHLRYLCALMHNDHSTYSDIESNIAKSGYGPLVTCTTLQNSSSVRVSCPFQHRGREGHMLMTEMVQSTCHSKFIIYTPNEEFRQKCPRILVACHTAHTHPIPLPSKTPQRIRAAIENILTDMREELADMTPRKFIRNPLTRSYLRRALPDLANPMLSDLHSSLSNMDHLDAFITNVQKKHYSEGTAWRGLLNLKQQQDVYVGTKDHYIREAFELPWSEIDKDANELNLERSESDSATFKFILCMYPERSADLLKAQYVQSDISHKRIAGFKEFVIGSKNPRTNQTTVYCRVFMNSSNSAAHKLVFDRIRARVLSDTGELLKYRHIHSPDLINHVGLLHWSVDQDSAQIKGLGMHLQAVVLAECPDKRDLHNPNILLRQLTPYQHSHRFIRLCTVHFFRNVERSSASLNAKRLMRTIPCVSHQNWDVTIRCILADGKAARDWVADKQKSGFAFEALCWEKSYIPLDIWLAGDSNTNIIESSHADVNREGVQCSLVGGIEKGQHFDTLKLKSEMIAASTGITNSYVRQSKVVFSQRSYKRQGIRRLRDLNRHDEQIRKQNSKLLRAKASYDKAKNNLRNSLAQRSSDKRKQDSRKRMLKQLQVLQKEREKSYLLHKNNIGSGSVKVIFINVD